MWGTIVGIVLALLSGAFGSWFYFVKIRGKKAKIEGKIAIEISEKNDYDRKDVQEEIKEQIRKNKKLQEELKKKLAEIEPGE